MFMKQKSIFFFQRVKSETMDVNMRFILLTGAPGVGKTTIVKKVCEILKSKNYKLNGFFTEEIRENKERIGFDIVTLDGKRAPMARVNSLCLKGPNVGKYTVNVSEFESCALPVFKIENGAILVLDEIGKMELLSNEFKRNVQMCFHEARNVVLATVPISKQSPIVEKIKTNPQSLLITVNTTNRNTLVDDIVGYLTKATSV